MTLSSVCPCMPISHREFAKYVPELTRADNIAKRLAVLAACTADENQILNLTACHLTKCSEIKQAYEILYAKRTKKIWCKNILTLQSYRDFRAGVF